MVDIAMEADVAAPIIERFATLQGILEEMRHKPISVATSVDNACGEFKAAVADATDAFHMSWRQAFDTCGVTAGLIGANTNVFEVELQRVDAELAVIPDISGG
ncbi:hypothetical protein [Nocardioides sp. W7]|uniref:hypothetical protein n=1 Tax=Nocardioides sp. W7 TaxID=2931390 RepID=UPI001FD56EA1|nr:hypothetical protein [Nocardioides sp. W7]